jgi:hypothetical protein
MHKAMKNSKLKNHYLWAWNECLKYGWILNIEGDRFTFGRNTNIEFLRKT